MQRQAMIQQSALPMSLLAIPIFGGTLNRTDRTANRHPTEVGLAFLALAAWDRFHGDGLREIFNAEPAAQGGMKNHEQNHSGSR